MPCTSRRPPPPAARRLPVAPRAVSSSVLRLKRLTVVLHHVNLAFLSVLSRASIVLRGRQSIKGSPPSGRHCIHTVALSTQQNLHRSRNRVCAHLHLGSAPQLALSRCLDAAAVAVAVVDALEGATAAGAAVSALGRACMYCSAGHAACCHRRAPCLGPLGSP